MCQWWSELTAIMFLLLQLQNNNMYIYLWIQKLLKIQYNVYKTSNDEWRVQIESIICQAKILSKVLTHTFPS